METFLEYCFLALLVLVAIGMNYYISIIGAALTTEIIFKNREERTAFVQTEMANCEKFLVPVFFFWFVTAPIALGICLGVVIVVVFAKTYRIIANVCNPKRKDDEDNEG